MTVILIFDLLNEHRVRDPGKIRITHYLLLELFIRHRLEILGFLLFDNASILSASASFIGTLTLVISCFIPLFVALLLADFDLHGTGFLKLLYLGGCI